MTISPDASSQERPPARRPRRGRRAALVGFGAIVVATVAVLLFFDPEPAPAPERDPPAIAAAPPAADSGTTRVEPDVKPAPGPAAPLVPLPPDPIARRIAAGEDLHTLSGFVVDELTGEAIELFQLVCKPSGKGDLEEFARQPHNASVHRNPLGTFARKGIERGRYDLLVRVEGYQDRVVPDVPVPYEGTLVVPLSRGAYVDGVVSDLEGDEIGDVEIRLQPVTLADPERAPRVMLRRTDAYGRFRFTDLPPGLYRVQINHEGLSEYATQEFYLAPGAGYPVHFQIPTLHTITVSVRDPDGHPLNRVHVRLMGKSTGFYRGETGVDGAAEIEYVAPGEYTVKLWRSGYQRVDQPLAVAGIQGERTLELVLTPSPEGEEAELHPTKEQLERLKAGERPDEVFGTRRGG